MRQPLPCRRSRHSRARASPGGTVYQTLCLWRLCAGAQIPGEDCMLCRQVHLDWPNGRSTGTSTRYENLGSACSTPIAATSAQSERSRANSYTPCRDGSTVHVAYADQFSSAPARIAAGATNKASLQRLKESQATQSGPSSSRPDLEGGRWITQHCGVRSTRVSSLLLPLGQLKSICVTMP